MNKKQKNGIILSGGKTMINIIIDTLLDTIKLLPFLFIAFLIIELLEHKITDKSKNIITRSKKYGPIIGSLIGIIPQCGFSVIATNLYTTRIITLGTLIAIYLSTSDEMLPILISEKIDIKIIISILLIKLIKLTHSWNKNTKESHVPTRLQVY